MSFQAYIDAVTKKTGLSPEQIRDAATTANIIKKDMKATEFCNWLASEYELGRGHSMALWNLFIGNGWIITTNTKLKKRI